MNERDEDATGDSRERRAEPSPSPPKPARPAPLSTGLPRFVEDPAPALPETTTIWSRNRAISCGVGAWCFSTTVPRVWATFMTSSHRMRTSASHEDVLWISISAEVLFLSDTMTISGSTSDSRMLGCVGWGRGVDEEEEEDSVCRDEEEKDLLSGLTEADGGLR